MQSTCPKSQRHPHAMMSQPTQSSHPRFLFTCPHPLLSIVKATLAVLLCLSNVTSLAQTSIIWYRSPHQPSCFPFTTPTHTPNT